MCFDTNCAQQAEHYINMQLSALYDNAVACLNAHDKAKSLEDHFRYSHALADFFIGEPGEEGNFVTIFHATFDKPRVDFICKHDAILRLKIRTGYYCPKPHSNGAVESSSQVPSKELSEVDVDFRVQFNVHQAEIPTYRNKNIIHIVVLDLQSAKLVSLRAGSFADRDAIRPYLTEYLRFLQRAGNGVLFSLPEFDDSQFHLRIEYPVNGGSLIEVDQIYGVAMSDINAHLWSMWKESDVLASGYSDEVADWNAVALAQYRLSWIKGDDSIHLRVKFGTPSLKVVCSEEVVLVLRVDEIILVKTTRSTSHIRRYEGRGWEIALLADVNKEGDGDSARICRLDAQTTRECQPLCKISELDNDTDHTAREILLTFFRETYVSVLDSTDRLVVYDDRRVPPPPPNPEPEPQFDQIIAISEVPIKEQFGRLWKIAQSSNATDSISCLWSWTFQEFFETTFRPLEIVLLSDKKAIVWICLEDGFLTTLRDGKPWDGGEFYNFQNWRLAFEVNLAMRARTAEAPGIHEAHEPQDFILDLSEVDYIEDQSDFHGVSEEPGTVSSAELVDAVLYYIRDLYFVELQHWGFNKLVTIPILKQDDDSHTGAFTDATFSTWHPNEVRTRDNWTETTAAHLVILCMTDFHPLPPSVPGHLVGDMIRNEGNEASQAVVALSREVIIDRGVLVPLALLNKTTTIIPLYSPLDENGNWKLDLTTWAKDARRSDRECSWKLLPSKEGDKGRKWTWQQRVAFSYEQEGDDIMDASCYASSKTRNQVELRASSEDELQLVEIKMSGDIQLEAKVARDDDERVANTSVQWGASLALRTDPDGMTAKVLGVTVPAINGTGNTKGFTTAELGDLRSALLAQLPKSIDLDDALNCLQRLGNVREGFYIGQESCMLANPQLNANGDLIFELRTSSSRLLAPPSPAR